jgi:O-antigen/teichoic acid export membrane protein
MNMAPPASTSPLMARLKRQYGPQAVTLSVRLIDLPLRYGMHVLIALQMPLDQMGAFYVAFGTMLLISGLGRIGIDRALTREMAQMVAQGDVDAARLAFFRGLWMTTGLTILTTAGFAAAAWPVAIHIMHKPAMALPFLYGALAIAPQNYSNLFAGALSGLQRITQSQIIYTWAWPAGFCAAALLFHLDAAGAMLAVAAAMSITAIAAGIMLLRAFPPAQSADPAPHPQMNRQLMRTGLSLFSWEAVQLAISGAPPFMLGAFSTTDAVALYAIAWRVVLVVYMFVTGVSSLVSPRYARLYGMGDMVALRAEAGRAIAMALGLALIPISVVTFAAPFLLGLLGAHLLPAVGPLRILLIGQLAATITATTPELLGMTGYGKALLRINVVALVVLLAGLALATPTMGAHGAALATSITMVITALATTIVAQRTLGFTPLGALLAGRSRRAAQA